MGERAAHDGSLNDKAISLAITKLVLELVTTVDERPWRSSVVGVNAGLWMISSGRSQGIREGDSFALIEKGQKIVNPQTGLPLELPGKQVAVLKVAALAGETPENEVALCTLEGSADATNLAQYVVQELKQ